MTAKDIQRAIVRDLFRRSFVLPNYTPHKWWECDVFEVTTAGFFREYEIKLSKSDFNADRLKSKEHLVDAPNEFGGTSIQAVSANKHELLSQKSTRGPNNFFYVLPDGMDVDVPVWAGIIRAKDRGEGWGIWRVAIDIERSAPRLHESKVSKEIKDHANGICYWRMHGLFLKERIVTVDPQIIPGENESVELLARSE